MAVNLINEGAKDSMMRRAAFFCVIHDLFVHEPWMHIFIVVLCFSRSATSALGISHSVCSPRT